MTPSESLAVIYEPFRASYEGKDDLGAIDTVGYFKEKLLTRCTLPIPTADLNSYQKAMSSFQTKMFNEMVRYTSRIIELHVSIAAFQGMINMLEATI